MSELLLKEKGSISPETRATIDDLSKCIEQESMRNITIDKGIAQAQAGKSTVLSTIDEICNHEDEQQLHIKESEDSIVENDDVSETREHLDNEENELSARSPSLGSYNEPNSPAATENHQNELRHRKTQSPSSSSTHDHEGETAQIEHVLQHHRQMQEELTSDLGKMAAQLKSNSLAFGDLLEKDDQVLRDAQDAVASNLDRLRKERTRVERHNSKSWGTTFMTCGVVLFVSLMFVLVFFTIKFLPKAR
ncbi:unnamed protein product [Umbelopsis vinacea]